MRCEQESMEIGANKNKINRSFYDILTLFYMNFMLHSKFFIHRIMHIICSF